jgi:hypothetical protein
LTYGRFVAFCGRLSKAIDLNRSHSAASCPQALEVRHTHSLHDIARIGGKEKRNREHLYL